MRLWSEIEFRRRSPAPDLHIVFRTSANWYRFVRGVGNIYQHLAQSCVIFFGGLLEFLDLDAHVLGLGDDLACILSGLFHARNLSGQTVSFGLQCLGRSNCLPALGVSGTEVFEDA